MQDDDGKSVVLMKYENNWISRINIVENWTGKMQITYISIPNAIHCYCTKLSNMTNMGTYCFKHTIPPFQFIDKVIIYTWLLIGVFFWVFFTKAVATDNKSISQHMKATDVSWKVTDKKKVSLTCCLYKYLWIFNGKWLIKSRNIIIVMKNKEFEIQTIYYRSGESENNFVTL